MSGMLANLVGAASAALNLRSKDAPGRSGDAPRDGKFASALNAALSPRERADRAAEVETASDAAADARAARSDAAGDAAARAASSEAAARVASAADEKVEEAVDAADATSAAAAAGPGPVPRSPTVVVRDVNALDPEFRARLERVVQRMETEHGHKVEIVETVRNQSRQDHLFAQGRTRPGPVVTWTRSSNHTAGRAADLIVDGTYDNPLAMVRLARIAREEGLQTLGSRDPGHVELPGGVRVERFAVGADPSASLLRANNPAELSQAARAAAVQGAALAPSSGVAQVAQVAQLAQVAQVATVARVATPGPIGGGRAPDAPNASPAPASMPGQMAAAAAGAAGVAAAGDAAGHGGHGAGGDGGREGRSEGDSPAESLTGTGQHLAGASHTGAESRTALGGASEARGAAGAFGAEAAERIARVLQLQDAAPTRPLSQMVLRLDNAMGGEDRIRVDLRGGSVGAALSVGDPVVAARMHAELGQLQKALEGRGLQAEHLSVTAAIGGREVNEAMRSALPGDAGQRSGSDPDSGRGGWNGRSGGRSDDGGSENPRHRPRRNPQEGRNT